MISHWIRRLLGGLGGELAGSTPLVTVRFVVLDTELTSLDKRTNRLLSVGAIGMQGSKIRMGEEFYRVVNPGVEIPADSILVHGLRPADVTQGDATDAALRDLREFIRGAVIVGHFVGLDWNVLSKELRGAGEKLVNPIIDTAAAHRWLELHEHHVRGLDELQGRCDLATLAEEYGLEMRDAHHALYDAYITAQLWQKLLARLHKAGIDTLGKALRVAK
ncbi:MAG TPA: 3'-5' exonuclease [Terriglobales bacterium]|nr:3'-5' exonuclease [Terriglobales bacterium]